MSLGLAKGKVGVVRYDPNWAKYFEKERKALQDIFQAARLNPRIEHVGSTSVPALAAKPIVDIAIGFPDSRLVTQALEVMLKAGYNYVKAANQPGMLFMAKGNPREFHFHLVVVGTPAWRKLLVFRNYLRRHAGVAADYGELKTILAERFPDSRLDYMRYKRPMLRAIYERSKAEDRRRRHAAAIQRDIAIAATRQSLV
jgi:GrpB-like predicted nucleotidyltransferase (UPF0157 family)